MVRPSIDADIFSTHKTSVNHIAGESVLCVISIKGGYYIYAVDMCWGLLEGVSASGRLSVN